MQKINTSTTPLRIARKRIAGVALVAGIVASGMLAPLTVSAGDEAVRDYGRVDILTSDEAFAQEADQMRQQDEAQANRGQVSDDVIVLTPEEEYGQEMDQSQRRAVVRECTEADITMNRERGGVVPSCEFTRSGEDAAASARQVSRERQARTIAEAYAADHVYTLYDAESVLASNQPEATKRNILGMIAPTTYLAMTNGREGLV